MTELRQAAEQALAALEEINKLSVGEKAVCLPAEIDDAMETLRRALAQPDLAKVGEIGVWGEKPPVKSYCGGKPNYCTTEVPCKTHPDAPHGFDRNGSHNADRYVCECEGREPPKKEWVGLTDEDLEPMCDDWRIVFGSYVHDFAKSFEAKLREKNT